jgi:hypothetical protein
MKFKQHDDGSCDIEFSDQEIKILIEKRKLHLSKELFKDFSNILVAMVVSWNEKFNDNLKTRTTDIKKEINTE